MIVLRSCAYPDIDSLYAVLFQGLCHCRGRGAGGHHVIDDRDMAVAQRLYYRKRLSWILGALSGWQIDLMRGIAMAYAAIEIQSNRQCFGEMSCDFQRLIETAFTITHRMQGNWDQAVWAFAMVGDVPGQ